MKKHNLDFIVAGIQKSGTTMLKKYLSQNDQLFIPPEKELPFFLEEKISQNNWNNFLENYFYQARNDQLWGTVTPQYLMYPHTLKKINRKFPKIKIIIIYRDPINRFISYYDMTLRLNNEKRNINKVIKDQIKNIKSSHKSYNKYPTDDYIIFGEYFRLNKYLKIFPKKNVLKISFDEFKLKPKKTLERISKFLKIKNNFYYSSKIIMAGGKKKLLNIDHDKIFKKIKSYLIILKIYQILPKKIIRFIYLFSHWLDQNNVNKKFKSSIKDINDKELNMLRKHYKNDILEYKKFQKKK